MDRRPNWLVAQEIREGDRRYRTVHIRVDYYITTAAEPFGAAVAAFPVGMDDWNLAPGQGGELGVRAGLVALDDQQVASAAAGQAGGVLALGVQASAVMTASLISIPSSSVVNIGISSAFVHMHLPEHYAVGVVKGGKQVTAVLAAMAGAA